MTSRSHQYLRSDYIQPPPGPPTLDAKQSPLALLARTCSAIGKDVSSKTGAQQKTFDGKKSPGKVQVTSSRTSPAIASSPKQVASPQLPCTQRAGKRGKSPVTQLSSPPKKPRVSVDSSKSNYVTSQTRDVIKSEDSKSSTHSPQMEKFRAQSKRRHTTSRSSHDDDVKKSETSSAKSPLSPYPRGSSSNCGCPTSNTDPRNVTGNSPHLFDPYCMSCQAPHVAGAPCFEGLKSPSLPFYPFTTPGYPLYAQMVMAAAARSGPTIDPTPHVCNWVNVGSGNCGKRFATADELFTHLRTHALSSTPATGYMMGGFDKLPNPYATYLSQQAAALAAVTPSTNLLSRSHSPLSRYHPYKTHTLGSQLPTMPSLPIPAGVGPYCSPFALYGQRLGAFPYN